MMRSELLKAGSIYKTASSRLRWILFALATLAWTTPSLQAAVYYVARSGSDTNSGTQVLPFASIGRGVRALKAGDTLYIRSGLYSEFLDSNRLTFPTGTSWSDAPRIAAYPGETVVLQAAWQSTIYLAHSYIKYLVFDGLIIDGRSNKFAITLTNGAHHVRFKNLEVRNSQRSGIILSGSANFNEFVNLKIHHNGTTYHQDHGLYLETSYNLVENCDVYANAAYGIHIYNGYSGRRADGNVIRSNRIHDNSTLGSGAGIIASSGSGNLVYNNVVWNHRGAGIEIAWRSPTGTKIYHNTLCKNGIGINIGSDSTGTLVRNNIAYYNSVAVQDRGISTALWSNLTSDPSFVDFNSNDYRPRSGSRAINAGILLPEVLIDVLGVLRPQGTGVDIGAYEYK